ncbi:MAG: hypothetical protein K2H26_06900 [Ruminococcus sp.]|nr:hypothetical protein [Ruminococcus sp.]
MKEAETKEEIFALPYYFTEDGRKRYIEFHEEDRYRVFDEYGRQIKDYWYGEWWERHFNDRNHTVYAIHFDFVDSRIYRIKRVMHHYEYRENYWKCRDDDPKVKIMKILKKGGMEE